MASPTFRRKNLVILRAGDGSLHKGWISHPRRDFDLFISYYGATENMHRDDGDYYEMRPGPKWPCIGEILESHPELLEQYDAFWFPDDDISAAGDVLNQMFALFHAFRLSLAQPALTSDSYYSWPSVLQRREYVLRFSNFVEVMVPIFDRETLRACLPTFHESRSGWGLDWVWPTLCPRPDTIAILDATPVRHTRPVGGNLYSNNPSLAPQEDERLLIERYDVALLKATAKYSSGCGIARVESRLIQRLAMQIRRWNARRRLRRRSEG